MKHFFAIIALGMLAAAQCNPAYVAIVVNGAAQQPAVNFAPWVASKTVTLNLDFENLTGAQFKGITGVSLMYTLDDKPIGSVLTDSFASTLDTTTVADGTHALSVLFVNEPNPANSPCYSFQPREYSFVVANNGVLTGAQKIPAIGLNSMWRHSSPRLDWVTFTGTKAHAEAHPYQYQAVAPAGGIEKSPAQFYAEPLLHALSDFSEGTPEFFVLKNGPAGLGSPVYESFYQEHGDYANTTDQPFFQNQPMQDGSRDDADVSPYSNFVSSLDSVGFYGIDLNGRLFKVSMDGSVQTIAGWQTSRSIVPYYYDDTAKSSWGTWQTFVGNGDHPVQGSSDNLTLLSPTDLVIDPRNHKIFYVADTLDNRIAKVDTSTQPPTITNYAGTWGQSGYADGAAASALFNQPYSLVIADNPNAANYGTMYVTDRMNDCIRAIDPTGTTVSTVVGIGRPGTSTPEPPAKTVAGAVTTYAPLFAVAFSNAYINQPFAMRFDSKGNLVISEPITYTVRYVDLQAQTVKTLANLSQSGSVGGDWVWLDVDRLGNVGAVDDVLITMSIGQGVAKLLRMPITGSSAIPPPFAISNGQSMLHSGDSCCLSDAAGHYSWGIAISRQEGRFISNGFGSLGLASFHILQPTDPKWMYSAANYANGRNIWINGTVKNFPWGSRPSFSALYGNEGYSRLGDVQNIDDMISMDDAQLGSFVQSGMDGAVMRPEITGNDLRDVVYFIRRTAIGGDLVQPGPDSADKVAPTISSVAAMQQNATSASVVWMTSKPCISVVEWGTTAISYFGSSSIETGYSDTHAAMLVNLPAKQTIHYSIVTKDAAGNQARSADATVTLQ